MMRLRAFSFFLCLPLVACAASTPAGKAGLAVPPAASAFQAPASVQVRLGDTFEIHLPANPSTGYRWMLRTLPAQIALLGMDDTSGAESCAPQQVGCPGQTTLFLQAVQVGAGALQLHYARPWEPLSDSGQTTLITVEP